MPRVRFALPLRLAVLLALALSLALALVGGPAGARGAAPAAAGVAAYPEVLIKATDYHFDAPTTIPAGPTRLTLENDGQDRHHAQLLWLNPGKTMADLQAALQHGPAATFGLATYVGGPGVANPGGRSAVVLDLQPGQYALLCLIPGDDNVPHFAKGMLMPLTVGAAAGAPRAAPIAETTVGLADFAFDMLPARIGPGQHLWRVVNNGRQPHELQVMRLAPGVTPEQLVSALAAPKAGATAGGPPPAMAAGGMQALSPGQAGFALLDLQPGNYVALCFVPDPASGKPHLALGMVMPFTVTA